MKQVSQSLQRKPLSSYNSTFWNDLNKTLYYVTASIILVLSHEKKNTKFSQNEFNIPGKSLGKI